eukprot:3725836-Lingulodinium_polyedra.AAC.1
MHRPQDGPHDDEADAAPTHGPALGSGGSCKSQDAQSSIGLQVAHIASTADPLAGSTAHEG